jgi:Ran GTPase-activating protein (RanGAP) involved in mRNA processing and transport
LSGLKLTRNLIGDAGVAALVGSALFRRMLARDGRIDLRKNTIGAAGAEALAASPDLARATALDLEENYLGDRGAVALVSAPAAAGLQFLRLPKNQITDAGAFAIADAITRGLPALQTIDVSKNRLTRRGADSVRDAAVARGVIPRVIENPGEALSGVHGLVDLSAGLPADLPPPDAGNVDELRRRVTFPAQRDR